MRSIEDHWQSFFEIIVPKDAPDIQVIEMRRSFYAGFSSALCANLEIAKESGDNDDIACTMLKNLHDECDKFSIDVLEGRA